MAKKETVDVRKLKDEIAEYLKKSKWEKAAEVLEKLVSAEPKDMSHRLKLGDTYRRMEQIQKSMASYQHAAKFFADEGQLIKAIGAVKVLLEIDPKNEDAQKQLAEMNERRFSKVTLETVGFKIPRAVGAGARSTTPIELEEAGHAAAAVSGAIVPPPPTGAEEEEPLELDDGKPAKGAAPARAPAMPQRGSSKSIVTPPPKPPEREEVTLDLDPDLGPVESLPEDAILTPSAEDLASSPDEEEIALDEEIKPAAAPPPSKPLKPAPPPRPKPPEITITDEILIEEEEEAPKSPRVASAAAKKAQRPPPEGPGGSVPIADLLSSDSEEEVELLSITSDEEVADRPISGAKPPSPDDMDLDSAFGKLAPQAGAQPKRVPTKKVPLFDDLSQEAFVELVNKLSYHRHVPGQLIIREGDPGRSFFIIVEGKVRIYKTADDKEITLAHLGEGAFFGEMALLSGAPRTANVVAEEDTEILEVTDRVLRELASHHPQVVNSLKNFYRQRLLNNVMAISPLFKDFDPAERKQIVSMFRMKQAAPGEVLIAEGKNSDGLYVVLHGAVQVATAKKKRPIELAKLKEGDVFGEMSLLTRQPATATVTSQGNSILLRLPRENFQELVLTHPQILELVSELTEKRKSATEAIPQGQGEGHDGMSFV